MFANCEFCYIDKSVILLLILWKKQQQTIRIASHFACLSNNPEMATVTPEL